MQTVLFAPHVKTLLLLISSLILLSSGTSEAGEPVWAEPKNLSDWQFMLESPGLAQNDTGTAALIWQQMELTPPFDIAMLARVRSPANSWSGVENITGFITKGAGNSFTTFKVAPDGTVWMAWVYDDGSGARVQVFSRKGEGNWQGENLSSSPAIQVRGLDFHIGPDGDLGLIWVDCSTTSTDYSKGGCGVLVRRRASGSNSWGTEEVLDQSSDGMAWPSIRVGPGGMMVATWASFVATPNWKIQGKACTSPLANWPVPVTDISSPVEPYDKGSTWISDPVMSGDGTFTLAWYHKSGPNISMKSATRMASSSTWTAETPISSDYPAYSMEPPRLAIGQDGTAAAAWLRVNTASGWAHALYVNVRDAGGTWSPAGTQVSGWYDLVSLSDLVVLPDGRTISLWSQQNNALAPKDQTVAWGQRSKGGNWHVAQAGNWMDSIGGAAIGGVQDDSVYLVWAEEDATLPKAEAFSLQRANCFLSLSFCDPPLFVAGGYKGISFAVSGVHFNPISPAGSVAWLAIRETVNMYVEPSYGVFFSQWPAPFSWLLFYPAMINKSL